MGCASPCTLRAGQRPVRLNRLRNKRLAKVLHGKDPAFLGDVARCRALSSALHSRLYRARYAWKVTDHPDPLGADLDDGNVYVDASVDDIRASEIPCIRLDNSKPKVCPRSTPLTPMVARPRGTEWLEPGA